eukprot:2467428-Heterocapsa_arctica.AAC.1
MDAEEAGGEEPGDGPPSLEAVPPPHPLPLAPPELAPPEVPDNADENPLQKMLPMGRYGIFTISPKQPGRQAGPHGGYQVRCPFHRLNAKSECKKYLRIAGPGIEDKRITIRRLMWWCTMAKDFDRQRLHLNQPLPPEQCPSFPYLRAKNVSDKPLPGSVRTDVELDRDSAVQHPGAVSGLRP